MPRATIAYLSHHTLPRPHNSHMWEGETRTYTVDARGALDGSSISSAAWTTAEGDDTFVTLGSATTSTPTTSIPIEAIQEGYAEVKATLTLADGRKLIQWFQIEVVHEGDISGYV